MKKLKYEITYQANLSDMGKKVRDFMVGVDMGIEDIIKEEIDIVEFKTSTEVTQKYIDKMGEVIVKGYKENHRVISLTKPVITNEFNN